MELEIFQVDAFASQPFTGNPAGVCITKDELTKELMLAIAGEMAVSETAFLSLKGMKLRWFTPVAEVNLCGHGTVAVAHILKEQGIAQVGETVTFNTLSGLLTAKIGHSVIELDFPSPELSLSMPINSRLVEALGIDPLQIVSYGEFDSKCLIELESEQVLLNLSPDFSAMTRQQGRGVLITASAKEEQLDFISRYFAPWVGVDEDPVTGSAHCALTVFWAQKRNKRCFNAYQASARGGYISTELMENGRVKLIGPAITVLKGRFYV